MCGSTCSQVAPKYKDMLMCVILAALQTQELQLAKRAIATKLLSLPQGIAPQPLRRRMVSACDACGDEIEIDTAEHKNLLVECDKCRVVVHMRCYGLSEPPNGRSWLCDVCRWVCS